MFFAHKQILWLLLVFPPAMIAFFWWSWRKRQQLLTQFIETRLLSGLLAGVSSTRRKIRWTSLVLAVVCIILALARPQWGFTLQEVSQRGLDVVVAIDTSKSMLAEDIAPNRLARAKLAALDLMQQARSDRLGLVTFAGSAFLQCPLTFDDAAFRQSVESLDVNTIPQGGTALAEAIDTALTAFREGDNYKTLVLFTDGEDQDSGAVEAAQRAAKEGLRVYTIGVGSAEGELLRIRDNKARIDYIRDDAGNVVKSRLNETLLREIAGATEGGFYLPLRGAKAIDTLYAELARLPKSQHQEKMVKQYVERYHWPLGLAIALLAFEMLFPERRREPTRAGARGAIPETPSPVKIAGFLILLALPFQLGASPSSALRDYRKGDYDKSLQEYKQLLDRKKDDPRLYFNAGTAAYQKGDIGGAAGFFTNALSAADVNLQQQAYYNLGNVLYRLGEQLPDLAQPAPGAPANGQMSANPKMSVWQQSLQSFQNAVNLDPKDPDAKFNYDFVKKKLEELKQQQQQQQSQQKQEDNKDEQKQAEQQQAKQDQQQQSDKKQEEKQSEQQQQQQAQQDKEKQEQQQQQQAQNQEQQKQEEQQQQQQQPSQGQKDEQQPAEQSQSPAYAAGEMTPQQAQQLLDSQKNDEMVLPIKPEQKPARAERKLRDW